MGVELQILVLFRSYLRIVISRKDSFWIAEEEGRPLLFGYKLEMQELKAGSV